MRPALRLLVLAGVAIVLAIPTAAAGAAPAGGSGAFAHPPLAAHSPLTAAAQDALAARAWNTSLAVTSPDVSPPPTSALIATPPPAVPDTTPTTMYFLNASESCCVEANYTAPAGPWAMIVLNYTGEAVNGVYDSSYRAYVDQSMVLFGTTPEYGTWTVLKDITEYSALFHGTFNLTFLLGAAVTNGYFLTSVSIAFYPVPSGGHAPREPDTIDPLWFRVSVTPSNPSIFVETDVPVDATNATLELYAYGFGPDEFWYTTEPGYRSVEVEENGTPIASVLPFQYINTGGIDLFTWRPVTGTFTLDDRPYELNVTAALGLLEGPRNLTARLNGVSASSDWIIGGSLLVYTNASAAAAQTTSYTWTSPPPQVHSTATTYDETGAVTYAYSSLVGSPLGLINVSLNRTVLYTSDLTTGGSWLGASWSNLTATEATSTLVTSAYPDGPVAANATTVFTADMDIGDAFVESSSNGGGYPIYGNFTDYFDNVHQQWSEELSVTGPSPADAYFAAVVGEDTAGTNVYSGEEELTGANAALLLAITSIQSETNQLFGQDVAAPNGGGLYNHLIEGVGLQPPGPYNAETILLNAVSSPLSVGVALSAATVDANTRVTFSATVSGAVGPVSVTWSGLPPGCSSANTTQLTCTPSVSGVYAVSASVVATTGGGAAISPDAVLVVNPTLQVGVAAGHSTQDVDVPLALNASVSGGTPAYSCAWSVDNGPLTTPGPCTAPYTVTGEAAGQEGVEVQVTDALGVHATSPSLELTFSNNPNIGIEPPANTTPYVGHPVVLTALVESDGAGVVAINWTVNGTVVQAFSGTSFTFVPLGAVNYTVGVEMTDADGELSGAGLTIAAQPLPSTGNNPSTNGNGGSGSSASGLPAVAYLAIGLAVGAVFGVGLMLLARPPPRRRPPRARPTPPPPPPYLEGPP